MTDGEAAMTTPIWTLSITSSSIGDGRVYYFRYTDKDRAEAAAQIAIDAMIAHRKFKNDAPDEVRIVDDFGWGSFPGHSIHGVRIVQQDDWDECYARKQIEMRDRHPELFSND